MLSKPSTAPSAAPNPKSSSFLSRATAGRLAEKQVTSKDARAKLKVYLAEALLVIDGALPPTRQAEQVLAWWKVMFSQVKFPCISLQNLHSQTSIGSQLSTAWHTTT